MHNWPGLFVVAALLFPSFAAHSQSNGRKVPDRNSASARRTVVGPRGPMNDAIAAGATATITVRPVPPNPHFSPRG
jgi:hypothetical protein